jgi:uncharacterized protein (TIGR03067 family)
MIRATIVLLLLGVATACHARTQAAESIDGRWVAASAELGGMPFPDEMRKGIKLVVENGAYTVTVGPQTDQGRLVVDASKKPAALDITGTQGPNQGKTFLAIYEKSGDTLRICYDLSGKSRPAAFATEKGSQLFLVTYEREKP